VPWASQKGLPPKRTYLSYDRTNARLAPAQDGRMQCSFMVSFTFLFSGKGFFSLPRSPFLQVYGAGCTFFLPQRWTMRFLYGRLPPLMIFDPSSSLCAIRSGNVLLSFFSLDKKENFDCFLLLLSFPLEVSHAWLGQLISPSKEIRKYPFFSPPPYGDGSSNSFPRCVGKEIRIFLLR